MDRTTVPINPHTQRRVCSSPNQFLVHFLQKSTTHMDLHIPAASMAISLLMSQTFSLKYLQTGCKQHLTLNFFVSQRWKATYLHQSSHHAQTETEILSPVFKRAFLLLLPPFSSFNMYIFYLVDKAEFRIFFMMCLIQWVIINKGLYYLATMDAWSNISSLLHGYWPFPFYHNV